MASKPPSFKPFFNNFASSLQSQIDGNENDDFENELAFAEKKIHAGSTSSSASTNNLEGRVLHLPKSLPGEDDTDDDNDWLSPAAAASNSINPQNSQNTNNSKFFRPSKDSSDDDNSESSSSSSSAQSTPVKSQETPKSKGLRTPEAASPAKSPWSGTNSTPNKIRGARHIIRHRDLFYKLIREDNEVLQQGLEHLNKLTTPERIQRTNELGDIVISRLANQGGAQRVEDKGLAVRRALFKDEADDSTWVTQTLSPLNITFIDHDHLTTFQDAKGKHICPLTDQLQPKIFYRCTNLSSGVWAGTIKLETAKGEKVEKFSTFVPLNMSADRYMASLLKARENPQQQIAKSDNKELLEIHHEGQRVVVECCTAQQGKIITTAYPLFHFETYRPSQKNLEIAYHFKNSLHDQPKYETYRVSNELILQLLNNKNLLKTCCIYDMADAQIFDIAILFNNDCQKYGHCPIERGVYVKIPKKYLNA